MRLLLVYGWGLPELHAFTETLCSRNCLVDAARDRDAAEVFLAAYEFDAVLVWDDSGRPDPHRFVIHMRREQGPDTPLVVLASLGAHAADEIAMLDAGADDYVRRPVDPDAFMARLRAICRRRNGVTRDVINFGGFELDLKNETLTYESRKVALTATEFRMLARICRKPGAIVTRDMLMSHMYDGRNDPEANILKVLASKIRRKMGAAAPGERRWLETVWGRGYVLRKEVPKPAAPLEVGPLALTMEEHA